jgi:Transport and Golgi organisation 2
MDFWIAAQSYVDAITNGAVAGRRSPVAAGVQIEGAFGARNRYWPKCIIAFAWRAHRRWPLVMIANRDGLHARPMAAADFPGKL